MQKQTPQEYYTAYQLKLPVEIEKIIEISDPVYSFSEVMDHIDLNKYLTIEERRLGRPRYDQKTLLKIILFAFMENGYASVREIEKYCKTDIRYMWLLQDNPPPSHMTIDNFMNKTMLENIDRIFADVSEYIFQKEQVDVNHVYIDGTKISANAAKTLGVSTDRLEAFFDNIDISYDDYINKLNSKNQTLAALKTNIETNYDCTFGEYIETVITVNNKTIPDAKKYDAFKSNLSVFDVYIRSNELNDDKNKLINYDVEIQSADTDNDVYAFDIIANCGNDFRNYVDIMNENYGCKSVELTNIAIFGGHGVKKPKESNPCMDKLFAYDDKTDEILEKLTLSVLTMHYDDDNDNVTFALSNELGLIFKATGSDSETKILNLGNIDFQICKATSEN